jgi:hypothetical protein
LVIVSATSAASREKAVSDLYDFNSSFEQTSELLVSDIIPHFQYLIMEPVGLAFGVIALAGLFNNAIDSFE